MKKIAMVLVPLAIIATIAGCEWSSGGDSSWSGNPDWVNFSGVYRGVDGGVLVTDYTATPGAQGVTNTVTRTIGQGDGGGTYGGLVLGYENILVGSVTINAASYQFTDDGSGRLNGNIVGTGGSINHGTGIVDIDLGNLTLASGELIVATFQYVIEGRRGAESAGSSGIVIYTFTVHQQGNKLTITDNNGSVYRGEFGNVETTTGEQGDVIGPEGTVTPATGTAVAQYTVRGVSAADVDVTMTGTMQGELGVAGNTIMNRIMLGTWIEDPGRTGDIQGHASPLAVNNGN